MRDFKRNFTYSSIHIILACGGLKGFTIDLRVYSRPRLAWPANARQAWHQSLKPTHSWFGHSYNYQNNADFRNKSSFFLDHPGLLVWCNLGWLCQVGDIS